MDPLLSAVRYIRHVKSNLAAGDGHQTYQQFLQTLIEYRKRNFDSSIVISTVQSLFRNNPNLLDGFKHFVPNHQSAAAPEPACVDFLNRVHLRSCVDFLNRVGVRFDGGGAYREFLEYMYEYSRGEITAAAVHDKVVGLFGENDDLVSEFLRFLPESGEGSRKRKIDRADERGNKRRRRSSSGSRADELKAAKRDNEMEDSLCEIDVRIGRLESAISSGERLYSGGLSPAGIRLDEHLTAVELACVRSVGRKFLERVDGVLLGEVLEVLRKKKEGLEKERVKIVHKWNRIRQSRRVRLRLRLRVFGCCCVI